MIPVREDAEEQVRAGRRIVASFDDARGAPPRVERLIDQGETVQFIQPGVKSRVLNRISGESPSSINGTIQANGIVYFVNPSGIVFGPRQRYKHHELI